MPADFEKCVSDGGRVRTMKMKDGKYMHICYDKAGNSHAGEVKKKKELRWDTNFILEDFTPEYLEAANITAECAKSGKKIKGVLLRKESRNGRIYELDAMIKAERVASLPLPISMNHGDNVSDNVGLLTKLIPTGDGLDYEGFVFNTAKYPDAIEMMQKGLISKISIEADNPIEEEIDGKVIIKGFDLMGAGFVKYAGIPQASASIAEAFENFEEVKTMEEDVSILKAKLEAYEKSAEKQKLEEADKVRLAEQESKKKLEESIATLQSEVKSLKEIKKSGIITGEPSSSQYQIIEKYTSRKADGRPNAFVFEDRNTTKASFWPVCPEEFY